MLPRRCTILVLLMGTLTAVGAAAADWGAHPEALLPEHWAEGFSWEAQPVHGRVSPDKVRGGAPFVPAATPVATGSVEVDPEHGAVFWLSPLEVVRVSSETATLRFVRVPKVRSGEASGLRLDEPGIPVQPGRWYLAEPMGSGSVWVVTATESTRVRIERPTAREGALPDEAVRMALLRWVEGKRHGPPPFLPAELRTQLEVESQLAFALTRGVPEQSPLHAAVLDWRKASALRAWSLHQPLHPSTFRLSRPRPPGTPVRLEGMETPFFQQAGDEGEWTLELEGPGVLAVDVRPLPLPDTEQVVLQVQPDGRVPRRLEVRPRLASMSPEEVLPVPSQERKRRELASGEAVGVAEELRVTLQPGKHTYRVQWKGGPVLLRARVAQRRPWMGELLAGEVDWEDLALRSWKRVQAEDSPLARLLRRQITALEPAFATTREDVPRGSGLSLELQALIALEEAEAATDNGLRAARAKAATEALLDEGVDAGSTLVWHLRLRLARLLLGLGRADETHRLMSSAPSFPESGWQAAEAAAVVARLPQGHPFRSRQLAALELAWRLEPLSEEIRHQYREAWWHASRWGTLHPAGTKAALPVRQRWLDVQPFEEGARSGTGALWPLRPGSTVRVRPTGAAETPTLLRAYVLPSATTKGPLVLHVGTRAFPLLPLTVVEPVEVALPPGDHLVRLEADEGTRAFLSLSPVGTEKAPEEVGYVHTQWPVKAGGQPVRFRIPEPHLTSPVRVMLRVTKATEGPVAIWMRTDIGPPRRMVLESTRAGTRHFALDGGVASAPAPVSVVLPLPAFAREVWFEPESADVQLVAALSVRRPLETEAERSTPTALSGQSVEALLTLSRKLSSTPEASELLLARAELLLSLAEEPLAREDLARVLGVPEGRLTPEQTRHVFTLMDRLEEAEANERVRFAQPLTQPMLLAPGFAALADAGNSQVHALAGLARQSGAPKALERLGGGSTPAERYLRARLLAESGQQEQAARELVRLYQRTGQPQLGLEALAMLERSRTAPKTWVEGGAQLGSVLATQLGAWAELPLVRRMRAETGRWTRWERLLDAEEKAGSLDAMQEDAAAEVPELVRKALIAPPWPLDQARLLSAGGASVLDLVTEGPRRLGIQGLCRPMTAGPKPPEKPCTFALRVDGLTVAEKQAGAGETVELTAPLRTSGRHQLEVVLNRTEVPVLGLVRFVTLPEGGSKAQPLPTHQPLSMLRGRPGHPVVMTVRGPTALRVSARALSPQEGRYLLVRSTPLTEGEGTGGGEDEPMRLVLPVELDTSLQGQSVPMGQEREAVLLLPERGAYRVRLEPTEGEALVRVQMAVAEPPSASLAREWPQAPTGPEPLPWPALPPPLSMLPETEPAAEPASELGMLSMELTVRREDVGEGEISRPLRTGLEARVGLRRELVPRRAWLRLEPQARFPMDTSPVLGTHAALHLTGLPLELRATLRGALFAQQVDETLGWSARGWLSVDRRVQLSPDLSLIPGMRFALESQQVGESEDTERFDRSVFWRYGQQHPRRLTPELALRWQPVLDHVGTLSAWATSNADLYTADHVSARARWSALLGGPLPYTRASLSYELSQRFQDAHRSEGYLRHGLRAQLDWSLWTSRQGRLQLFAEDQLLLSEPFGPQNMFSLGLRWDWTGGRGLRDVLPDEEEFERLLDAGRSPEGAVTR
ncbi:hypothetical protein [Archangium sp.]|uniref:hypothetical protein n=1 Tax=Archangium sp. TaxID=1872627 RepID=UPI00286B032D|nr:hypothetical protein [Archangium sp.]